MTACLGEELALYRLLELAFIDSTCGAATAHPGDPLRAV
jgi:hypothetical protein